MAAAACPSAIIAGDFNARHESLGDTTRNSRGIQLNNELLTLSINHIFNDNPTYIGGTGSGSVIDHFFVTDDIYNLFKSPAVVGTCVTSDHVPLLVEARFPGEPPPTISRTVTLFNRANWKGFRDQVDREIATIHCSTDSTAVLENAAFAFTGAVVRAAETYIPKITLNINPKRPPLPAFIVNLIKEKRRLYRRYKVARDPSLKTEWNRLNAIIRLSIASHKEKLWNEACSKLDHRNGSAFWKKFKTLTGQFRPRTYNITRDGLPLVNDVDRANAFRANLAAIHQTHHDPSHDVAHQNFIIRRVDEFLSRERPDVPFTPFTPSEVAVALACKKNTAPGPDMIPWKILSNLSESAVSVLTNIYNVALKRAAFPSIWKEATVIMIRKPGKPENDVNSYRPISLLNTLGKGLERLLVSRAQEIITQLAIIPEQQAGFRRGHCSVDLALRLQTDVIREFHNKRCVLAIMLDVARAFDTVWHFGLLYKLIVFRFPPYLIHIISNFLTNRKHQVKIFSAFSSPFSPEAGVPQGAIISPTLYTIYTSDIPRPPEIQIGLYADDTCIWVNSNTARNAGARLQRAINSLENWTRKWKIKINPCKSQLILFTPMSLSRRRHFDAREASVTVGGRWLGASRTADYLGFRMDHHLSARPELTRTLKQIKSRASLLYRLRAGISGCSARTLLHTYRTFVRPVAEYRWPLFVNSPSALKVLAAAERRILRIIMRKKLDLPAADTYSEADMTERTIIHKLAKIGMRYIERRATERPAFLQEIENPPIARPGVRPVANCSMSNPITSIRVLEADIELGWFPGIT